ncbi:MAG: hypothetical protein M1829_003028 [Trizodia sp. TS-e1964]|nr:MAG: hypothetical protein M1829_003028 [Trizodia sp. TS-e1964]
MQLRIFSLLAASLSLAHAHPSLQNQTPSSKDNTQTFPQAFAHILPSKPGKAKEIAVAAHEALDKAYRDNPTSLRWLLFGMRARSDREEWGFVAAHVYPARTAQTYTDYANRQVKDRGVLAIAPPGHPDERPGGGAHYMNWFGEVLAMTDYYLVPLKAFADPAVFMVAPVEAKLAYDTNIPQDLWYWYDQFFRAMGVDTKENEGGDRGVENPNRSS